MTRWKILNGTKRYQNTDLIVYNLNDDGHFVQLCSVLEMKWNIIQPVYMS